MRGGLRFAVVAQQPEKLSTAKAKKTLARRLKVARRINSRKDLLDESGKTIVEGIIATVDDGGSERTLLLHIEKTILYTIDGTSLHHIEEYRKLEAQPNKSLDASGGSVNCKDELCRTNYEG